MKGKYEYANDFWRKCEREPFTPSEIALYMLLLHEANQNRWVMPFRCNTAYTCYRLTTTKQNIFKARLRLKEKSRWSATPTCKSASGSSSSNSW